MPAGRPTKYKPEYCDVLREKGRLGLSFEVFCADIGIAKDTAYNWIKKYPEFSDAKKDADALCYGWWQRLGKKLASGQIQGNAAVWIFNMKNRFLWRDKREIEHSVEEKTLSSLVKSAMSDDDEK